MVLLLSSYNHDLLSGCTGHPGGLANQYLISGFSPDTLSYIILGLLFVLIIYLIIMYQTRHLVKTRRILKQREQTLEQVACQKAALEINSLIYAQRIQEALLPSEEYFRTHFQDSFIFFRPKDIVSGDFYWIGERGDKIFIAGADCTGHGVPGALLSMIGLEIIEKTINEDNIEKPSEILAVLNKELEKTFSREKNIGTIIRDGMDVGFCMIDRGTRKAEYAGAFFPLYLIRNNSLIEIKGDKIIIGMNPACMPYTNHVFELQNDDILYIFSDGYVDQFGGSDNKKFMYRRFKYLLNTIHRFPLSDQKAILDENINTWMAGNPQIDDIMVIGFRPFTGKESK